MANHETEAGNKPHDGRGNVVYSRRLTAEERARRQEEAGADARTLSGGKVSPTLPTLLAGFVLLLALVYGLGYSSVREMQAVSERVREESQMRSGRTKLLLELNNALAKLNNEARERDSAERRGGIINPFDLRLRTARGDVRRLLASFERLPAGQTDAGQRFRRQLADYIGVTEDLDRYSLEGFPLYRNLDEQLDAFIQQMQAEQENLNWQSQVWENEAQSNLDYLTILAVITGIFVAGVTTWEVQRRFRQVRRSLAEARRERQFNAQMIEGMVSAVAAIDAEGRIRSANESFQQLLPEATVGASIHELRAGEETTRLLAKVTGARVDEPMYHGRRTLAPEQAAAESSPTRERSFDVYSSPLDIDGERGQILTLVDVTEAAEAEREVRRTESLAAVGQAAAQVAHEIRNPLGSIRLGVAMLRDMTDARDAHNTIDLVERGIDHLNKLTVDVTQYSRERKLSLAPTNVHELLDSSLELIADQLQRKGTPVERGYSEATLTGLLDEDQLRQVFVNLLANAVDAGVENSPITLSTALVHPPISGNSDGGGDGRGNSAQTNSSRARITITDKGVGMDEATKARIFEPFFTTKKRGTGLGLAIVKKIIAQHGGTITVESATGKGTSFVVELPLGVARRG